MTFHSFSFPADCPEATLAGQQPLTIITSDHHKQVNGILSSCFITGMSDRERNNYNVEGWYLRQTSILDRTKEMGKEKLIVYVGPCIDPFCSQKNHPDRKVKNKEEKKESMVNSEQFLSPPHQATPPAPKPEHEKGVPGREGECECSMRWLLLEADVVYGVFRTERS